MGERFLIYRIDNFNSIRMGKKAAEMTGKEAEFRKKMSRSFHKFCNQFANIRKRGKIPVRVQPKVDDKIVHLACLVAVARTGIDRDRYTKIILYPPHPEGPARLIKQLKTLGFALAFVHGKSNITKPIFNIVKKVACDAVPELRMEILSYLWDQEAIEEDYFSDQTGSSVRTSEIAKGINKPISSVKMVLEDMMTLGIVNRDIEDSASGEKERNKPYLWQISREISKSIDKTEFLDQ
jgi:hypothetical protein